MAGAGFTLVELLVVIAVIMLLARMLLPAIQGARARAKAAVCVSNLKQIGVAFDLYIHDYDHYPSVSTGSLRGHTEWVRRVTATGYPQYCGPKGAPSAQVSALGSYANPSNRPCRKTVFWCPMLAPNTAAMQVAYVMNGWLSDPTDFNAVCGNLKAEYVDQPSETYILYEALDPDPFPGGALQCNGSTLVPQRHFGGAHSLFCDGHVQWNRTGPTTSPPSGTINYDLINCRGQKPLVVPFAPATVR